ncbi:thiamine pyrophosphate-binding protein [Corynebacterium sp. A21]|uniref:thiamine pyrophosphate-binding protein n=1 Tax=Corynebacterium sp. A21 TaxID=3457318 RepID=UPI003FD34AE3
MVEYSLSEVIARVLIPRVDAFFGIMGNGNAWFVDAVERLGPGLITVRHEVAAVAAADAYHRVNRRPAVATTTYGPGFTNTLTSLSEAALAGTPLILVTGTNPGTNLGVDQHGLAAAVGVETFTATVADAVAVTHRALQHALSQRTPVVLEIPYELAALPASFAAVPEVEPEPGPPIPEVAELLRALKGARQPLLLAGRGARGASISVRELAALLRADVVTSAPARGLFHGGESFRDLGVCGGFAAVGAAAEIRRADVVLVLGAGLNRFTLASGRAFSPTARVFQVDLKAELTSPRVDHFLRGEVGAVSDELLAQLRAEGFEPGEREHRVGQPLARPSGTEFAADGRLDPRPLLREIDRILPPERIIATDGGHFLGWANTYLEHAAPDRIILLGTHFESIGLGFATAVGVAAAAGTGRLSVLVTGDGGALMGLADAESFIRTAHRGVVLVCNDAAYGAEIHHYGSQGLAEEPMLIPEVNFAAVLGALGAKGKVINRLADLVEFQGWVASGELGTYVLDCRISRSVVAPFMQKMVG